MKEFDKKINEKHACTSLVNACQKAASYNLFQCNKGNMSLRLDDKHIALSASNAWIVNLTLEQVAVCRISDGTCVNNKKTPIEINLILGIMQTRTDINAVLLFQSPCATTIACGNPSDCNFNVIPEIPSHIGKVAIVEYLSPGSTELARTVIEKIKNHNMVIMRNQGLITVGKDFDDAIQKAVFFELACFILLTQSNPVYIPDSSVELLRKTDNV